MNICVFGASSDDLAPVYFTKAEELGYELGKRGHGLVFGGGAHGLMGAAARGAARAGGEIIGVAPHFFNLPGILFEGCTELIRTETMRERKAKMEDLSDAFVTVPGGIGTFEEFFEILTLKQLGRHRKPVALFHIADYYAPLRRIMENSVEQGFALDECLTLYGVFSDVRTCLDYIESYEEREIDVWKMKKYR